MEAMREERLRALEGADKKALQTKEVAGKN